MDNDGQPLCNVEIDNLIVNEGDGYAMLDVRLSSSSGKTTRLELDADEGKARKGKLDKPDIPGKTEDQPDYDRVDIPSWKANPFDFNSNVASPIGEFIDEFYIYVSRGFTSNFPYKNQI